MNNCNDDDHFSLRVKFTDPDDDINPLHGAESEDQVDREMKILFPMETTVAVIKPDVYEKEDERGKLLRSRVCSVFFMLARLLPITEQIDVAIFVTCFCDSKKHPTEP